MVDNDDNNDNDDLFPFNWDLFYKLKIHPSNLEKYLSKGHPKLHLPIHPLPRKIIKVSASIIG